MKKIAVFCGSNLGLNPLFANAAKSLAEELVKNNIEIVYGGARVGIMGILADTALKAGGTVIGVIPKALVEHEVAHTSLTELHVANSMHERKALMEKLADGFIMLPGGPGSWEEFFEMITWAKLGYHHKPCGILNSCNYYNSLIKFLDHSVEEKFVHEDHRNMILIENTPKELLEKFLNYTAPRISAWIEEVKAVVNS